MQTDNDEQLRFSRRNRVWLSTKHPRVRATAAELATQQEGERGKAYSEAERRQAIRHLELLLLDLLAAYRTHPELYVGFSASMRAFANMGSYWDPVLNAPSISKNFYLSAARTLEKQQLANVHWAPPGRGGISSRIRATTRLIDVLQDVTWADIKSERGRVIVKRDDAIVAWPQEPNFDPQQAQARLDRINMNLEDTFVNLGVSDRELEETNRLVGASAHDSDSTTTEPIDFSNRTLNRIFAEGTFAKGGRFYGGWWQSVPSKLRKFIEIDGRVTVELDFSSMQPRALYAEAEAQAPHDAYVLPGWSETLRPLIKTLFSQLLNSDPSSSNPRQWHRFAPIILPEHRAKVSKGQQRKAQRAVFKLMTGRDYAELIEDLLEFHAPIRHLFFTKAWGRMQRLDSDIAELVMLKLLDKPRRVTALPIHDSFIVGRGDEAETRAIMLETFREVVGADGDIDRDPPIFVSDEADPAHLVMAEELHAQVRSHMATHRRYYAREEEWTSSRGPID